MTNSDLPSLFYRHPQSTEMESFNYGDVHTSLEAAKNREPIADLIVVTELLLFKHSINPTTDPSDPSTWSHHHQQPDIAETIRKNNLTLCGRPVDADFVTAHIATFRMPAWRRFLTRLLREPDYDGLRLAPPSNM
ncbi:hypothetical protein MMC28_004610 [Mycoblastus sanguinarius]|nr:hypothetical protein [Mycoblastus sanguinarius]